MNETFPVFTGDALSLLSLLGMVSKRSTSRITLSIWAIATITVALAGPFGTFTTVPTTTAIAYWALVIGMSILVSNFILVTATQLLSDWPRGRLDLFLPAIFTAVYTPLLHPVGALFLGPEAAAVLSFWQCLVIVLVIAYGVMLLQRLYRTGSMWVTTALTGIEVPQGVRPASRSRARLLDRVDTAPDARVLRVSVDNHYVILHLQDGSRHRLLMRFADAIAELDGVDGFQTHRSHWVACGAIVRVLRVGGREIALMVDGETVPISRTCRNNLERRGFLTDGSVPNEAAPAE